MTAPSPFDGSPETPRAPANTVASRKAAWRPGRHRGVRTVAFGKTAWLPQKCVASGKITWRPERGVWENRRPSWHRGVRTGSHPVSLDAALGSHAAFPEDATHDVLMHMNTMFITMFEGESERVGLEFRV